MRNKYFTVNPKNSINQPKKKLTTEKLSKQIDEFLAKGREIDVAELQHTERRAYPARFSEG
jgi:hypothetical protein